MKPVWVNNSSVWPLWRPPADFEMRERCRHTVCLSRHLLGLLYSSGLFIQIKTPLKVKQALAL